MKKSACTVGKFCLHEDRKVQILTKVQPNGMVGVGWDCHGEPITQMVYCVDLEPLSHRPDWVTRAMNASVDFHYGVEAEIEAIWEDSAITDEQKKAKIERLMVNARHGKWGETTKTTNKSNSGRRYS